MSGRHWAWVVTLLCIGGCTTLPSHDPLQVTVAGIEPLALQGLELRMLTRLRVQNPNDSPIDYRGVYVKIELQGKTFATGVTDVSGTVPAFGESIIEVPVTASAMRMAHQVFGERQAERRRHLRVPALRGFGRVLAEAARTGGNSDVDLNGQSPPCPRTPMNARSASVRRV